MNYKTENVIEITLIMMEHIQKNHFSFDTFPYEDLKEFIASLSEKFEYKYSNVDWIELDYREEIIKFTNMELAKELWQRFGDVPMNPATEEIEKEWNGFSVGTHREEIWHWFEEAFNISVTEKLMGL